MKKQRGRNKLDVEALIDRLRDADKLSEAASLLDVAWQDDYYELDRDLLDYSILDYSILDYAAQVIRDNLTRKNLRKITDLLTKPSLRDELKALLAGYIKREGTDEAGGIRDILTDLMHIADEKGLNFKKALAGAREVYDEEI